MAVLVQQNVVTGGDTEMVNSVLKVVKNHRVWLIAELMRGSNHLLKSINVYR